MPSINPRQSASIAFVPVVEQQPRPTEPIERSPFAELPVQQEQHVDDRPQAVDESGSASPVKTPFKSANSTEKEKKIETVGYF